MNSNIEAILKAIEEQAKIIEQQGEIIKSLLLENVELCNIAQSQEE